MAPNVSSLHTGGRASRAVAPRTMSSTRVRVRRACVHLLFGGAPNVVLDRAELLCSPEEREAGRRQLVGVHGQERLLNRTPRRTDRKGFQTALAER